MEGHDVLLRKTYTVDVDGQRHQAVLAGDDQGTELRIDGAGPVPARARVVLGGRALLVEVDGRRRLVHLSPTDAAGGQRATLGGRPVRLLAMDELRAQALRDVDASAGSGTLAADIPGLVVEIRVKAGQAVRQGEPLIVVEAMKMQNELAAGIDGIVERVAVTVGQTVNPGDVLVVVSPES
ncbi:MAG: biotin/lipoyl-binding protein [bacterium]|nr:biotin/lipoyl-binding protein [bacterium]